MFCFYYVRVGLGGGDCKLDFIIFDFIVDVFFGKVCCFYSNFVL